MGKRKTFRRVKVSGHGYMPGVSGRMFSGNACKYRTCHYCGAHLDFGERCDCLDKESAAPGAANTKDGKGGESATRSASSVTEAEEEIKA